MREVAITRHLLKAVAARPGSSGDALQRRWPHQPSNYRSDPMLDIVLVGLGIALFALTLGYAYACDWL
ncbi:hypothetical protein MXD81_55300 [Microbacteriaceae bacterium K1510]|nr:hypothetical protein [Microbacteriaceae bacterium K1510]